MIQQSITPKVQPVPISLEDRSCGGQSTAVASYPSLTLALKDGKSSMLRGKYWQNSAVQVSKLRINKYISISTNYWKKTHRNGCLIFLHCNIAFETRVKNKVLKYICLYLFIGTRRRKNAQREQIQVFVIYN